MILALDIGNTNLTLGCIEDDNILFEARISTDHSKTGIQYAVEIKGVLDFYRIEPSNVDGVIISSVVPPLSAPLKNALQMITGKTPILVGPGVKTGLNILIDNPAQLGSDLVVGAVAALNLYKPPLIIFDMGTATTISVINENGAYIGGYILPGVMISLDALASRTSQLPKISLESPKTTIGKNTVECMQSGIINSNASMIDGMIERIEKELGQHATAIATGGIAQFITTYCKRKIVTVDNLLLQGLNLLYKKNTK